MCDLITALSLAKCFENKSKQVFYTSIESFAILTPGHSVVTMVITLMVDCNAVKWIAQLLFLDRLPVAERHTSWHTQIHKAVLFQIITRSSADTGGKKLFSWKNKWLSLHLFCSLYLHGHGAGLGHGVQLSGRLHRHHKRTGRGEFTRRAEEKKTTIPICHSCHVECWDCSSDCRISINLEMQLDTGASDREGETLSRSITSLACHSYMRPDWFI